MSHAKHLDALSNGLSQLIALAAPTTEGQLQKEHLQLNLRSQQLIQSAHGLLDDIAAMKRDYTLYSAQAVSERNFLLRTVIEEQDKITRAELISLDAEIQDALALIDSAIAK